jgi:hypothetical protein
MGENDTNGDGNAWGWGLNESDVEWSSVNTGDAGDGDSDGKDGLSSPPFQLPKCSTRQLWRALL